MTRRMSSRRVKIAGTTFALLAMGTTLAACDSGSNDEDPNENGHFYCTDANGNVVNEDACDDPDGAGGGFFFMYMGSSMHAPPSGARSYPVGSRLPTGAQKLQNTSANRSRFGLPPSGRISNGTVKTGVVGKGGPGSAAKSVTSGGGKSGGGGSSGGKSSGG